MTAFDVAKDAKGWLHDDEGPALYDYAMRAPDGFSFLEVGSYCGKSTCYIGQAALERETVLWAVDWHSGSPEMREGAGCYDPSVVVDGQHDTLPELRRNLKAAGVDSVVIPVVGHSHAVGDWWQTPVGFVFIDGDHTLEGAVGDYQRFSRHVVAGGYLLFHDAYGTDARYAVEEAKRDGWHEQALVGCTAIFRRD